MPMLIPDSSLDFGREAFTGKRKGRGQGGGVIDASRVDAMAMAIPAAEIAPFYAGRNSRSKSVRARFIVGSAKQAGDQRPGSSGRL
jgi:hypothetical protein